MSEKLTAFIAVALVSIITLAACNGSDDGSDNGGNGEEIDVNLGEMVFEPDRITAEAGSSLTLNLENVDDQLHDFTIDDFNGEAIQAQLESGQTVSLTLDIPDEATESTYYCSVPGHQALGMEGTIVVE